MGVRCNPLPSQVGIVYQFYLIGQYRAFAFTNGPFRMLNQTIEPIPDDFAKYFRDGFVAMAYRHSPEKSVRAKASDQYNLWIQAMTTMRRQGDRERDNSGFYATSVVQTQGTIYPGPSYPFALPY